MRDRTRRGALAMMAGGALLFTTDTAGVTSVSAGRGMTVTVAGDRDASLLLLEAEDDDYMAPHDVRIANLRNESVELEATSADFDVTYLDDGGDPLATDSVTLGTETAGDPLAHRQVVRTTIGGSSSVTGTLGLTASGTAFTLDLDRSMEVFALDDTTDLNCWTDSTAADTTMTASDTTAVHDQAIETWYGRNEGAESVHLAQSDSSARPTYRTQNDGLVPALRFDAGDELQSVDGSGSSTGTDLQRDGTTKAATVFLVVHPTVGRDTNRRILRLRQNDDNRIRFRHQASAPISVTLDGVTRTVDVETAANRTDLITIRLIPEETEDGVDVLLEARRNGTSVDVIKNFGAVTVPGVADVRIGDTGGSFAGSVGDLLVYNRSTDATVSSVEGDLLKKWNL